MLPFGRTVWLFPNMQQQQFGAEVLSQFRDVRQDGLVGGAVFEGDKDFLIHGIAVGGRLGFIYRRGFARLP